MISGAKYGASPRLGRVAGRSVLFPGLRAAAGRAAGNTCGGVGGKTRGDLWIRSLLLPCSKFCFPVTPVSPAALRLSPHGALRPVTDVLTRSFPVTQGYNG